MSFQIEWAYQEQYVEKIHKKVHHSEISEQ